jgi:hypothetical protein
MTANNVSLLTASGMNPSNSSFNNVQSGDYHTRHQHTIPYPLPNHHPTFNAIIHNMRYAICKSLSYHNFPQTFENPINKTSISFPLSNRRQFVAIPSVATLRPQLLIRYYRTFTFGYTRTQVPKLSTATSTPTKYATDQGSFHVGPRLTLHRQASARGCRPLHVAEAPTNQHAKIRGFLLRQRLIVSLLKGVQDSYVLDRCFYTKRLLAQHLSFSFGPPSGHYELLQRHSDKASRSLPNVM